MKDQKESPGCSDNRGFDNEDQMHGQYASRRLLRQELSKWVASKKYRWFVTLAPNDEMLSTESARNDLFRWDARVNRKMLGVQWTKKPDERVLGVAFIESIGVNPHWHILLDIPVKYDAVFPEIATIAWLKLAPAGTIDVQRLASAVDVGEVARYITKQLAMPGVYASFEALGTLS